MKTEKKPATNAKPPTSHADESQEKRLHEHADKLSKDEQVDLSSFDSFPASDPPSWSPTTSGEPTEHELPSERDPRKPG